MLPYFDLSFQHASAPVLRRMRRFGDTERFLELVATVRAAAPTAGIRSNVIVGFPGETEEDLAELERFLTEARLDVVGVFGYSDEDGTEAATLDGKLPEDVVAARVERVTGLVDELVAQRAEERVGETVSVLVEELDSLAGTAEGRGAHQGPEVDGTTTLLARPGPAYEVGEIVTAVVVDSHGADLVAERDVVTESTPAVSAWNIANALTVLRLVLVPVFLVLLFHDDGHDDVWRVLAFVVFAVASVTDRVDGEIARRRGHRHRLRQDRRPDRRQGPDRCGAGRAVAARRAAVVGHGGGARARDRRDAAAVLRHPARCHAGQPRRQGQDDAAGRRHRAAGAAARRRAALGGVC